MTSHFIETSWLDGGATVTLQDLASASRLSIVEVEELVEYGALTPLQNHPQGGYFSAETLIPLRKASRIRRDYDLDLFTVVILFEQLRRIEALEHEVHSMRARSMPS